MAYAPTYAPELNIVGFATGGTPANLTANTLFLEGVRSQRPETSLMCSDCRQRLQLHRHRGPRQDIFQVWPIPEHHFD